jgi:hypothetical protein
MISAAVFGISRFVKTCWRIVGDSETDRLSGDSVPKTFRNGYTRASSGHQIITFLTKKGIISPKLQLISGHTEEKSLAIYRDLALVDVSNEYEEAMKSFRVK